MTTTTSGIAAYYRRPVPSDPAKLADWIGAELLRVQAAFQVPNSRTVTAAYSATVADDVILVNAASGTVTVTFPDPTRTANKCFIVKKIDASANAVTIGVVGGTTIDGGTSTLATQWAVKMYQSNGALWYVLSSS